MSKIVEFDQKLTEIWPKQKKVRFCKYLVLELKWMIKKPKWQVFCRHFKIFLCFLDSDTSDDVTMILSDVSELKKHRNILKWWQKTCHFDFLIIHFKSKTRYLQNLTFYCFGHISVHFWSNSTILDIFKQLKRWAVQKCPR